MTNQPFFFNPVGGANKILELDRITMSRKTASNNLNKQSASAAFPKYTIVKFERYRRNDWEITKISFFGDDEHMFSLTISITDNPALKTILQRIEAPFLGITGPVSSLHIDKNNFSDYTASLDKLNSFVVSAKGNAVVHTIVSNNKGIDGMSVNKTVLKLLF